MPYAVWPGREILVEAKGAKATLTVATESGVERAACAYQRPKRAGGK